MTKAIFDNTVSSLDSTITENETKNKSIESEFKKLKTLDLIYFIGKSYFEEVGTQNYLIFQPIRRYFQKINTKYISSGKSKGLSDEVITLYATSDNSLTPLIDHYVIKERLNLNRSCLKQSNKFTYDYGHKVNVYVLYELSASSSNNGDPLLKNCLLGAVTLTKNSDIEKYGYSGYGIGFDRRSGFSFPGGGFGQNELIFGVHMSSSPANICWS